MGGGMRYTNQDREILPRINADISRNSIDISSIELRIYNIEVMLERLITSLKKMEGGI